jgi:Protein of unknown function (DUF3105)
MEQAALTNSNQKSTRGTRSATGGSPRRGHQSTSPTGTTRSGRRDVRRRHQEPTSPLQRFRTPILALVVIAVVVGVSAFVFVSAAAPAYACTTIDTVQPAASGELGQIQPDMGNQHVQPGDKITYPVCPPASGKHINRSGFGPLQPKVYGPDDQSVPNGWVHNLEHGGLVLLYSCDKGACDDASFEQQLQAFSAGFPASPVCGLAPGIVGPVVARFEQMPTRYAALLWNRVLYLDTLDVQGIYDFFTRYGEVVAPDGTWLAPPEPQCSVPSPSTSPSAAPSASSGSSPAPSPSAAASPAASPAAS